MNTKEKVENIKTQLQTIIPTLALLRAELIDKDALYDSIKPGEVFEGLITLCDYITTCQFYGKQRALLHENLIADVQEFDLGTWVVGVNTNITRPTSSSFGFIIMDEDGNELPTPDLSQYYITKRISTNNLVPREWEDAYYKAIVDSDTAFKKIYFTESHKSFGPGGIYTLNVATLSESVTDPVKIMSMLPLRRNLYEATIHSVVNIYSEDVDYYTGNVCQDVDYNFYKALQNMSHPAPIPMDNPTYWEEVEGVTKEEVEDALEAVEGTVTVSVSEDIQTIIIHYLPDDSIINTYLDILLDMGYTPSQKSIIDINTEPGDYTETFQDDVEILVDFDTYGYVIVMAEGLKMNSEWDYLVDDPIYAMELSHAEFVALFPECGTATNDVMLSSDYGNVSTPSVIASNPFFPYSEPPYTELEPNPNDGTSPYGNYYNQKKWTYDVITPGVEYTVHGQTIVDFTSSEEDPLADPDPEQYFMVDGYVCKGSTLPGEERENNRLYPLDMIIKLQEDNGYGYKCINPGYSDVTEPTGWPTEIGLQMTDGSVTWECTGKNAGKYDCYFNDVAQLIEDDLDILKLALEDIITLGDYVTSVPHSETQRALDSAWFNSISAIQSLIDTFKSSHDGFDPLLLTAYPRGPLEDLQAGLPAFIAVDRINQIDTVVGSITTGYSKVIYDICNMLTNIANGLLTDIKRIPAQLIALQDQIRRLQKDYDYYNRSQV